MKEVIDFVLKGVGAFTLLLFGLAALGNYLNKRGRKN